MVKFTKCQAHFVLGMKRTSDNIQCISVWNDSRMEMTPTVQQMKQISFLYSCLMAAVIRTLTAYSFICHGWTRNIQQISEETFFSPLPPNPDKNIKFSLFQQKYFAWLNLRLCIRITSKESTTAVSQSSLTGWVTEYLQSLVGPRFCHARALFGTHSIQKLI